MKTEQALRTVVLGIGSLLLLASSAVAQEIVNTEFDDGPGVAAASQPAAAPVAKDAKALSMETPDGSSLALITAPAAAEVTSTGTVQGWVIAILLVGIGLASWYALIIEKRLSRNLGARSGS